MLKLSRLTDYATLILSHIARLGGSQTARDIAVATHLNLPTVSKILKQLTRRQLLSSERGTQGGYYLTLAPHEITLVNIITAMDARFGITECSADQHCQLALSCHVQGHWRVINQAVYHVLSTITLADLLSPAAKFNLSFNKTASSVEQRTARSAH